MKTPHLNDGARFRPKTLNVIDLSGLSLTSRKISVSEKGKLRLQDLKTKNTMQLAMKKQTNQKNIVLGRTKDREDQTSFSDYRIKYGPQYNSARLPNATTQQPQHIKQTRTPTPHLTRQHISTEPNLKAEIDSVSIQNMKHHLGTEITARRVRVEPRTHRNMASMLNVTFFYMHHRGRSGNVGFLSSLAKSKSGIKGEGSEVKLDGWAINPSLPLEADKKEDIIEYTLLNEQHRFLKSRRTPDDKNPKQFKTNN